jgi:hypothetical protein
MPVPGDSWKSAANRVPFSSRFGCLLVLTGVLLAASALNLPAAEAATNPSVAYGTDAMIDGTPVGPGGQKFQLVHTWKGIPGSAPICHYDFRRWQGGDPASGGRVDLTVTTTTTHVIDTVTAWKASPYLGPGVYWYQVRAVDCQGHVSPWVDNESGSPSATQVVAFNDTRFNYDGQWAKQIQRTATNGERRVSSEPGATATLQRSVQICGYFPEVGVVAEKGPGGGVMGIYFGGVLQSTVDLYSEAVSRPQVVGSFNLLNATCNSYSDNLAVVNLSSQNSERQQVSVDGLVLRGDIETANPH